MQPFVNKYRFHIFISNHRKEVSTIVGPCFKKHKHVQVTREPMMLKCTTNLTVSR